MDEINKIKEEFPYMQAPFNYSKLIISFNLLKSYLFGTIEDMENLSDYIKVIGEWFECKIFSVKKFYK